MNLIDLIDFIGISLWYAKNTIEEDPYYDILVWTAAVLWAAGWLPT